MPPDGLHIASTQFHVRFAETDAMGIVHHAAYIVWFEEGRSAYSRQAGAPYSELEDMGFSLAVAEVQARYLSPARYDQVVTVRCRVDKLGSRGIVFGYEVLDSATQTLLVTGTTRHICVNRAGQVARLPEAWLDKLQGGLQRLETAPEAQPESPRAASTLASRFYIIS